MPPKKEEPSTRVDKGTISILNACMILVFALGQAIIGTAAWKDLQSHQVVLEQQVLAQGDHQKVVDQKQDVMLGLLETINNTTQDHSKILETQSKKIDTVTFAVNQMETRAVSVYADRFGTYDNYLAWEEFVQNNPSYHLVAPDVYRIRAANPPTPGAPPGPFTP